MTEDFRELLTRLAVDLDELNGVLAHKVMSVPKEAMRAQSLEEIGRRIAMLRFDLLELARQDAVEAFPVGTILWSRDERQVKLVNALTRNTVMGVRKDLE